MHYKPSRFNFRTTLDDGEILLYNSMAGTLSAVPVENRDELEYFLNKNTRVVNPQNSLALDLIEGGYLVADETDESEELMSNIRARGERNDLFISVMPTEDCNFRCIYCFEHFKRGAMSDEIQNGVYEFIKKNLEQHKYTSMHLNWFGGEPLYSFDVIKNLGAKVLKLTQEIGIEFSSSMTTNGYLMTPDVFEELIALQVRSFVVTLDGLEDSHDMTRVHRDGYGTFAKIADNLRNMRDTDHLYSVVIRSNFSPEAYSKLNDFLKFLKTEFGEDMRFDNVDIRPIFNNGGFNEGKFDECVATHMNNKFKGLELAREYNFFNRNLKYYIQPGGIVCNASKPNYWLFGSDGKMMRCNLELDTHERNVVGQVYSDGHAAIDYDKLARWLDAGADDASCHKCFFAPSCQGAYCAQKRFANEENNVNEQPCPTEKKQLSQLLRVVYEEMLQLV